jgi:hypothetical protein
VIIVKVELWSAIDGSKQELGRVVIDNIGGTNARGDYRCRALRGRSRLELEREMNRSPMKPQRTGIVTGHARLKEHVWNLVAKGLTSMGYGL